MASRLGAEYPIEIETTSKPLAGYQTDEWADTELPCAPAIMIGEEIVAEGSDISEEKVVAEIRKQLGMTPLEPEKKGILSRLFKS
jgi:hypothetical protein